MSAPRLKSEIRAAAIVRRAISAGCAAVVVRKGDADAGAIAVKVYLGRRDGAARARLFMQVNDGDVLAWRENFDQITDETEVDVRLAREAKLDRDLWVIEIEDAEGRAFLD